MDPRWFKQNREAYSQDLYRMCAPLSAVPCCCSSPVLACRSSSNGHVPCQLLLYTSQHPALQYTDVCIALRCLVLL